MVRRNPRRASGEEWHTPHGLIEALCAGIGGAFDLDPCAPVDGQPGPPATVRLPAGAGGLDREWSGRVFLNPQLGPRPIDRWLDKALRSVHWDKSARTVVASLPVAPQAEWWTTYVRGWATVLLIRRRGRGRGDRAPFSAALALWGDARPFRAAAATEPRLRQDGVWLPAYRADSRQAPFLPSLLTQARMQKLYGSYDDFRSNLAGWTRRPPPEYVDALSGLG